MTMHTWSPRLLSSNRNRNLNPSSNSHQFHRQICVTILLIMASYLSLLHLHHHSKICLNHYSTTYRVSPTTYLRMHLYEKQRMPGYSRKKSQRPSEPRRIGSLETRSLIPESPTTIEQVLAGFPVKQQVKRRAKLQVEHPVEPAVKILRASTPGASNPIPSHSPP